MAGEWARMYNPPPRESHLLRSLRGHTKDSMVWVYWDSWHRKVAKYENTSRAIGEWLEKKLEDDLLEKTGTLEMELAFSWLFGDILLVVSGEEPVGSESLKGEGPGEGIMHVAYSKDSEVSKYLLDILKQAQGRPEWPTLKSAVSELRGKESQQELRRMAKEMDHTLVVIELMNAFPGRCELCPV